VFKRTKPDQVWLRVDPVACDGVGLCSHLAPAVVTVDTWGYPIVPTTAVERSERRQARRAVAGCPKRALFLEAPTPPPPPPEDRR
jgi:ferredoxin